MLSGSHNFLHPFVKCALMLILFFLCEKSIIIDIKIFERMLMVREAVCVGQGVCGNALYF